MFPYFNLFNERIYLFPLIISFAFMCCVGVFIIRPIYDKTKFKSYIITLIIVMTMALVCGKTLSIFSLYSQGKGSLWECVLISGNVFYGGLIGGVVALVICAKIFHFEVFEIFDVCASLLPLGQAIGRFGCFFNGCCYGKHYDGFLSIVYPVNGGYDSIFPTWFFESFFCFSLFVFLQMIIGKVYTGVTTSLYLISYSAFRFIIEFFRGDELRGNILWLSTSQFIGIIIFIAALFILTNSIKKKNNNKLFVEDKL